MNSKQIIITFITLITLIGIGWYCYRKFKPSTPNSTNEPINTTEENDDSIQKTESTSTKKPTKVEAPKIEEKEQTKKMISQLKFNEIKTYIFSQYNDDTLPADLSPIEKTKIEELKSSFQTVFQENQTKIEKQQKEIDDYNNELNKIENQKNDLIPQKELLEQQKITKQEEKRQKQLDQLKIQDHQTFVRLEKEINELSNEIINILEQYDPIKKNFNKLEIDRKAVNKKLARAENYKQNLESSFNKSCIEDDGLSLIVELNKLYKIN